MSLFTDFFTYQFLTYALIGGGVSALVCAFLSPFIVLQKMAFIGNGIAHSAFGGIAISLLLGLTDFEMYGITILFCLLISTIIWHFAEKKAVSEDSGIGIFLSVSMALAIILISFKKGYTAGLIDYLFGSILAITISDIITNIVLMFVVIGTIVLFFKEFTYTAYDKEMAYASGIKAPLFHFLLLTLISLTVVISMKIIGIVLVTAFLILPGASSKFISKSLKQMIIYSVIISITSTIAGLILSNGLNIPSGAMIVMVQFIIFLFFMFFGRRFSHKRG